MKRLIASACVALSCCFTYGASYFMMEDFTNIAQFSNNFQTPFWYGRSGYQPKPPNPYTNTIEFTNGVGYFQSGNPSGSSAVNNMWAGPVQKYTNQHFNAAPTKPFGFEVIKTGAYFGFYSATPTDINQAMEANEIWLIQDGAVSAQFDYLPNALAFFEEYNYNVNSNYTYHGYFKGSRVIIPLMLTNSAGDLYNVTNRFTSFCDLSNVAYTNTAGWTNFQNANTNPIAFRVTHDGSTVRYYVNPNPYGAASGGSNEYCLVAEIATPWNTNLTFMIGSDIGDFYSRNCNVAYDSVKVISVADVARAALSNGIYLTGQPSYPFTFAITNCSISNVDAGVAEGEIHLPVDITNWVTFSNDTAPANLVIKRNGVTLSVTNGNPDPASVYVRFTNNNTVLQWRLCQTSDSVTGVLSNSNDSLMVSVNLVAVTNMPSAGGEVTAYVDNLKYAFNDNTNRHATTGKMSCVSNADGALAIAFYKRPYADWSVNPGKTYESSTNREIQFTISTIDVDDSPPIDAVRIRIPAGFTNGLSNAHIISATVTNDAVACYVVTNTNNTNYYYIDYSALGQFIPGRNGLDFITVDCDTGPVGSNAFVVEVMSRIAPTQWFPAGTNSGAVFNQHDVLLVKRPPRASAYVTPLVQYNTARSNVYALRVDNTILNATPNDTNNAITALAISLPPLFTNAVYLSNRNKGVASASAAAGGIAVSYSNGREIPAGSNDIFYFTANNTLSPYAVTNVSVPVYVSNDNGIDFVAADNSAGDYTVSFVYGPVALSLAANGNVIDVTSVSNDYALTLANITADLSNDISRVSVTLPAILTAVTNIATTNTLLSSLSWSNKVTGSDTNTVINLYYTNTRLGRNGAERLTFSAIDTVTNETNAAVVSRAANDPLTNATNNAAAVNPQYQQEISYQFPPPKAYAYIESINGDTNTTERYANYISNNVVSNFFECVITNYGYAGNRLLSAKVILPPFLSTASNVYIVATNGTSNSASSVLLGALADTKALFADNTITIDYGGVTFSGGSMDRISFWLYAVFQNQTNFTVTTAVSNVKYESNALTMPGYTNNVLVEIAAPKVYVGIASNAFYTNTKNAETFVIAVSNGGFGYNTIKHVSAVFPPTLAILSVSNDFSNVASFSGSTISIAYSNAAELPTNHVDHVYVTFTNTVVSPGTVAMNTACYNGNQFKSNTFALTNEPYSSNLMFMTPVTYFSMPVDIVVPYQVDISRPSNRFSFTVRNADTARSIRRLRVTLPDNVITNGYPQLLTSYYPSNTITWGSNSFTVTYPQIPINEREQEQFTIYLAHAETNLVERAWQVAVDHGDGFGMRDIGVTAGYTNTFRYTMPLPDATFGYTSGDGTIVTSIKTNRYAVTISNASGNPQNAITGVVIQCPSMLLDIAGISCTIPPQSTNSDSNNVITLTFGTTQFTPGSNFTFAFTASDTNTNTGRFYFDVSIISRYGLTNQGTVASGKNAYVLAIPPDYSAQCYQLYTSLSTAARSNVFRFTVNNLATAGSSREQLTMLRLQLPPLIMTNGIGTVSNVSGTAHAQALITAASVDVYFTNLIAGGTSTFDMPVSNTVNYIDTNMTFAAYTVFTNTSNQMTATTLPPGKSLDVALVMPQVASYNFISSTNLVFETLGGSNDIITVDLDMVNAGGVDNHIMFGRVVLPDVFAGQLISNVVLNTSLPSTNAMFIDISVSNVIDIYYCGTNFTNYKGTNFPPGYTNRMRMVFSNNARIAQEGMSFNYYAANVTNNLTNVMRKADLPAGATRKVSFVFPSYVPIAYIDGTRTFYSLETNMILDLVLSHRESPTNVTQIVVSNLNPVFVSNITLTARRGETGTFDAVPGAVISPTVITIPLSPPLPKNTKLYMRMTAPLALHTNADMPLAVYADVGTNTNYLVPASSALAATVSFRVAPYGIIQGTIYPLAAGAYVRLTKPGLDDGLTNINGAAVFTIQSNGGYMLNFVPPGIYDLEIVTSDFVKKKYVTNIPLSLEEIKTLADIVLKNQNIDAARSNTQVVRNQYDTDVRFTAPAGAVASSFDLEIEKNTLTGEHYDKALVYAGGSFSGNEYRLVMKNMSGTVQPETELAAPCTLTFSTASLPWTGALSVYAYDETAKRWIPVGGRTDAGTITITIRRLVTWYTVLPLTVSAQGIHSVTRYPDVFTPSAGGVFSAVKISFLISDTAITEASLSIYDVKGRLIRTMKTDTPNGQGYFAWDGKDREGFMVRSGTYIYQVRAGSAVKSGTVIVVK